LLRQDPGNTRIEFHVNNLVSTNYSTASGAFLDQTRYGVSRTDGSNQKLQINGSQVISDSQSSTGLPATNPMYIGARNKGTPDNFINASISYFLIGGGFPDLTALSSEMDTLELEFIIIPGVLANFTDLTATQERAIKTFVRAEYANRNWHTYDEFFLFPLGATNGVIGFKGTTGTNNNGTFDAGGWVGNGSTAYFDSGIDLSTLTNLSQNNAETHIFIKNNPSSDNNKQAFGVFDGTHRFQAQQQPTSSRLAYFVNTNTSITDANESTYSNNSLYGMSRDDSAKSRIL